MNEKIFLQTGQPFLRQDFLHAAQFFIRLFKMQMHDAADFNDGFGGFLHAVSGLDHLF